MTVLTGFHLADRGFFAREVLDIAPEVLGCILQRTEVEAYASERDPGAHTYRGNTNRNKTRIAAPDNRPRLAG
ncbi:DNA-3-methyladenine glycosylase [Cryobacterium sp. Y11]|uniref:DNA-3-methyladenine glycosylase n=1 Tax=Cryobacterium sp. Y11 TaxID=2045016 RepID=UPI000CE3552B|nr:DNA-3-methyladenine glycosylase [Cryobacterium sp. Y11]